MENLKHRNNGQIPVTEDQETRQRLLEAAERLFAERGFENVSVRDICSEAGANVAAVNYYFRDKWGLYLEVIQVNIAFSKQMSDLAHNPGPNKSPEDRLRHYIRTVLQHILREGECWQGHLMAREMNDPTPALDVIFEQAILPNSVRLHALVSEIMGLPATDPRVGACAGSIQTQIFGLANPIARRFIPRFTPEVIEGIAQHTVEFSLGGIRAIARHEAEVKA
jgi:AcrR family transcriptional regulator